MKITVFHDNQEIDIDDLFLACASGQHEWLKPLVPFDIDGWAITNGGSLILCDETGRFVYAPEEFDYTITI